MKQIFVIPLIKPGILEESAAELMAAAKQFKAECEPIAIACGSGAELEDVCKTLTRQFAVVWKVANEQFAGFNAEAVRAGLAKLIPSESTVLLAHEHFGMDLAPGLSVKLNVPYVPDIVGIEGPGQFIRQEFNGQFHVRVESDLSSGAVLTIRPGGFKPQRVTNRQGEVVDKSAEVGTIVVRRRFIQTIAAQAGDVDITKQTVLVSVGRGIQDQENIALAEELAEVLGGAVSCSRPVVDAKWLDKSRQVGSSGATVTPKVYMACGISGSFQHMAGIKGAPFLVAINKNPSAPIFQFADVGVVDDLLDFLPALTVRIREALAGKGRAATAAR